MLNPDRIVYLNGDFLPLKEARISVLDRGFLFGDGVYEVIPAYGGHLFRLEQHIQRLNNSLDNIRLPLSISIPKWKEIFNRLIKGENDQAIYLQITRGVGEKRDPAFPEGISPTVFAMCSTIPLASDAPHGIKAITLSDTRWESCHIKAITLLANILLRQEALDHDAGETILLRNGLVTEGSASNVFAVINRVIITPAKTKNILPGITRELVIELALANTIPVEEKDLPESELRRAEEIWIASSTREIVPVTVLDDNAVGTGQPGALWQEMHTLFQAYKTELRIKP